MCFVVLISIKIETEGGGRKVLKTFLKHESTSKSISLLNKCLTFVAFMENANVLWYFLSIYGILGKGFPVNQSSRKTST